MFSYQKKISAEFLNEEFEIVLSEIKKFNLPQNFSQSVLYILSELFSNVKEHSSAKTVRFKIGIKNKHFKLMVMDDGIGLSQSYANRKIISKSDQAAIELALG